MRIDNDPFPAGVNMINFKEKMVLVHSHLTRGKNVVMSNEPRARMMKPQSPEPGKWKVNQRRMATLKIRPTSDMLLEKYAGQTSRRRVFS
jgi:hypothetical protein